MLYYLLFNLILLCIYFEVCFLCGENFFDSKYIGELGATIGTDISS